MASDSQQVSFSILMKKVLVLCPDLLAKGGVANYYFLVNKYFKSGKVHLNIYNIEKVSNKTIFHKIIKILYNLYYLVQLFNSHQLIVFNPSFDPKSVFRDGFYHLIAKRFFKKKTLIFFRGWDPNFAYHIDRIGNKIIKFIFNADHILVLSSNIKSSLVRWGFPVKNIGLETTTYELYEPNCEKDPLKIIFLSRLVKGKGCLCAIKAVELLIDEFPNLKLYVVGEGNRYQKLSKYVHEHSLSKNVLFTGWLTGEKMYKLMSKCGIMLYPTDYGEGMPNSIVQGMGMGLPVITRPVAGITDIISNGKNGFLINSLKPCDFANKIQFLLNNNVIWNNICRQNEEKAKKNFEINVVVKRLEHLYYELTR